MSIRTLKLKWILPAAAAAASVAMVSASRHVHPDISVQTGSDVSAGPTQSTEQPKVTVNGHTVTGNGTFQVGPASVNVSGGSANVSSPGSTTTVVNSQGGIDVHVESSSSNGSSSSFVTTDGGTFSFTQSDKSIDVFQSGEGNISASN